MSRRFRPPQALARVRRAVSIAAIASLAACLPVPGERAPEVSVERAPTHLELTAAPGEATAATLTLTNPGGAAATVTVSVTAPWLAVAPATARLEGGQGADVAVGATCGDAVAVHVGYVLLEGARRSRVVSVRLTCSADDAARPAGGTDPLRTVAAEPASTSRLRWEPPPLDDPVLLRVDTRPDALELDPDTDYLIVLPEQPLTRGLNVRGGRNVVIIGGEIAIPHQGPAPSIAARRALHATHVTGVLHVEGVLMHGDDISEGIQINAPRAIVQIQNVGIFGIRARDPVRFSDNHPDLVQSYGNAREIRIDRFTGSTDYQGLFFQADFHGPAHGPVQLRHVNIVGEPTARYLLWFAPRPGSGDVHLEDVWLDVPRERDGGLGRSVWPDVGADVAVRARVGSTGGVEAATWTAASSPRIVGTVRAGRPPGGDFVRADAVGIGYRSPGYEPPPQRP